jgi:hypothetical protein
MADASAAVATAVAGDVAAPAGGGSDAEQPLAVSEIDPARAINKSLSIPNLLDAPSLLAGGYIPKT